MVASPTPPALRILIVRLDHVGDCVMTVPAMAAYIKSARPDSHLTLLTNARAASLLSWCNDIDNIIIHAPLQEMDQVTAYNLRSNKLTTIGSFWCKALAAKMGRFSMTLHLSFSVQERIMCMPLSKIRIGFSGPYSGVSHRLSQLSLTSVVDFNPARHLLDNCFQLIASIIPPPSTIRHSTLNIPEACRKTGANRLAEHGLSPSKVIGIHPGGVGSTKNWPLEYFARLAQQLVATTGLSCVLVGGPEQESSIDQVLLNAGSGGIFKLITRTFIEFASVASNFRVMVANDGGPAHVSAVIGTPTLVIFGPTDERVYAPRGPHVCTIRSSVNESRLDYPWHSGPHLVPPPSLVALTVEEVVIATTGMLERC